MFRFAYANQNNAAASAMCAEAASSCTSQSSRFNCIALGAIIMASILICGLILGGLPAILKNLNITKTALLVLAGPDDTVTRASANIAGLKTAYVNTINVLDILGNEKFIITEEAVKLVEEVYA